MDMILTKWSACSEDLTIGKIYSELATGEFLDDAGDRRKWYLGKWKEPVVNKMNKHKEDSIMKVGDEVKCIERSTVGHIGIVGNSYTVTKVRVDGSVEEVDDPYDEGLEAFGLDPRRFEPVVPNHEFTFGQRMTLVGFEAQSFYYVGTSEGGTVFFTREPLGEYSFTAGAHGLEDNMNNFIPYVEPEVKPEVKPTEYTVEELEELLGKKIKVVSK